MLAKRTWRRVVLLPCLWAILLVFSACQPDAPDGPRVDQVAPQPVTQGRQLLLIGEGFGEWSLGRSGVTVNGACADVLEWTPTRVTIVVPEGIGVGARQLSLTRADGERRDLSLQLQGADLPPQPRRCAQPLHLVSSSEITS